MQKSSRLFNRNWKFSQLVNLVFYIYKKKKYITKIQIGSLDYKESKKLQRRTFPQISNKTLSKTGNKRKGLRELRRPTHATDFSYWTRANPIPN